MKISFIIATYNVGEKIIATLESIITQKNLLYEIIVIDGGSRDNTIEYIKKYSPFLTFFLSESDNGIYDAWNKALPNVSGDWIMFTGAGDYFEKNFFKKINFNSINSEIIISDINIVDVKGNFLRKVSNDFNSNIFIKYMNIPHPGIIHKAEIFKRLGGFNDKYKIAGDYEFLLRNMDKLTFQKISLTSINMINNGVSNSHKVFFENYLIKSNLNKGNVFLNTYMLVKSLLIYFFKK